MSDNYHLGRNLRILRVLHNITQTDIAKQLNVKPQYISALESDWNKYPHLKKAIQLSEILGVTLDTLVKTDLEGLARSSIRGYLVEEKEQENL